MAERPELPLFAWAATRVRGDKRRAWRPRRWKTVALAYAGCGLLIAPLFCPPSPHLIWNASASAPIGLYWVSPAPSLARGDMVIAWPPSVVRRLAAARHYLPANVPLVKRVAGLAGDRLCATGPRILVGQRASVSRRRLDAHGRQLPWWEGCGRLGPGTVFLLMADVPDSFDGRYFGPTASADVVGRATALWLR